MMKKKALMFQGVSSSAGKSLCTAALCRIFKRSGLRVVPFKAQNMSLNSYISQAGEELGRAQALQAMACGLEADARMNPVLLKPMGNARSQVIVRGKVKGIMTYSEYVRMKGKIWRDVCDAYYELAESADLMLLEGAGSPAEINLQKHDIVNMRMAREAEADVLLVADIDRGGAFAALAGTMSLLKASDRKLVKGFILNRFRGDKSLLKPALDIMNKRYKRSFFGIIPMIEDLLLPEEDSASFDLALGKDHKNNLKDTKGKRLDIGLILLPGISNFTDFDPLRHEANIQFRVIKDQESFGSPDLLILPGTRTVHSAMQWLEKNGLAELIKNYVLEINKKGRGVLVGICGGLQLMGQRLEDPYGIEGASFNALGILPLTTHMEAQKILRRTKGRVLYTFLNSEIYVDTYEIRHGRSLVDKELEALILDENGQAQAWGLKSEDDAKFRIWGTYLHGIFENEQFRQKFLKQILTWKGEDDGIFHTYSVENEIDRLADIFAENMDLDAIYRLLEL